MNPGGGIPSGGPSGSQGSPSVSLSPEALSLLWEGISLVFSRWTALQLAVEDQTGGQDSCRKSEEFASTVLSWFSQTKELYIDDLENLLYENMDQLFYMDVCDDSVEQTISYMAEWTVGHGSFGIVFQAKCLETGETVAIKKGSPRQKV